MPKTVTIDPIMTKARKRHGVVYPSQPTDYAAVITNSGRADATISVKKIRGYNMGAGRIFKVGDVAEYDSYNLSYTGVITKITDKTVTIKKYENSDTVKRLDLETFAWRNYDFDAAETARKNAEEMMYL